jgi:hypothetical protein
MKNARIRTIGFALALLAVVPLASDQAMDPTCNATGSLTSGIADPVNGDEAFFKQVNPGSNVMLLLDTSISMDALPIAIGSTTITAPSGSPAAATPTVNGTCATSATETQYTTSTSFLLPSSMAWLAGVTPQRKYADPGKGGTWGSTTSLYDCPAWGNGTTYGDTGSNCGTHVCSGNNCLYDPDAYYRVTDASTLAYPTPRLTRTYTNSTGSSVTDVVNAATSCQLFDSSYSAKNVYGVSGPQVALDLGAVCRKCMDDRGFFVYNARYQSAASTWTNTNTVHLIRGTWLNGNPPKVVTARRVIKDLLWMTNDTASGKFDRVRFGLADFEIDNDTNRQWAKIISELVPATSAELTAPYSKSTWAVTRQPMINYMNNDTGSNSYLTTDTTPVGHSLFNLGQYFAEPNYFTYTADKTASWSTYAQSIYNPTSGKCSVCFPGCQKNAVIIVTDGAPNENETLFPSDITGYSSTEYQTLCGTTGTLCNDSGISYTQRPSVLPRVASWLHLKNLRPTTSASSAVTVTTHVIGFALPANSTELNIINAAAAMGGGKAKNASNASDLSAALDEFVSLASTDETSFSAPAVDTLQTNQSSTSDAFLSRFQPNSTNLWTGHVFQAALFDEFANGCDPTKAATSPPQTLVACQSPTNLVNPDLDGATTTDASGATVAVCNKVFLVDKSCMPIGENLTKGGFYQLDKNGSITNTPANLPWDAGQVLSDCSVAGYRSAAESSSLAQCSNATPRNIFTYLPNASGVLTKYAFTTANISTLQPYLSIEPAWCNDLLTSIAYSPLPSTAAAKLTECARQVVYFVRGYDIFNLNLTGCRGPGHPANLSTCGTGKGGERDRPKDNRATPLAWKLGDIFHSPPVAARIPADVLTCDLGYDGQCVTTLHSPPSLPYQTPIKSDYSNPSGGLFNAWDKYRVDNSTRHRVVIVGANDGMLHGFDAGAVDTSVTADALGNKPYLDGNGEELWAFIPPDLLPKLWRLVKNGSLSDHQYMVDGPTMIRDIWVDGSGSVATADGVKQADEFHTIAVLSERSGGTHFTALDVTDPTSPRMLWTFPQPRSEEAKYMSLSWTDFSARPPPIGPVRLALSGSALSNQDPNGRGFEERWIVMLNGGYDPTLVRGRAVFMVDAWTGSTIWRVTDDDLKSPGLNNLGFGNGTTMFPVPGAVALLDIGDTRRASFDVDGFFDTATWGDMGGNLWAARFYLPGVVGTSGRVENWFAARTFEQNRVASNTQNAWNRQPFFSMTANAYESTTRTLRTYIGSGNREQLMQQGATCSQDNLLGCCQAGCSFDSTYSENFGGACGWSSTFSCDSSGNMSHAKVTDTPAACGASQTTCASGSTATTSFKGTATVAGLTCPGNAVTTNATGTISCDSVGTCNSDKSSTLFTNLGFGNVSVSAKTQAPTRFYGVWSYGRDPAKMFTNLTEAQAFDANRFTDGTFATPCSGPSGSTCVLVDTTAAVVSYNPSVAGSFSVAGNQATVDNAGWFYSYQGGSEKTGAGANIIIGCTAWNGFIPSGASGGTASCNGSAGTVQATSYLSNFISGVPSPSCGYQDSTTNRYNRLTTQVTTAPPNTSSMRVVINASGQVEYSALQLLPGSGPSNKALATRAQVVEPVYWLEVPRDLHNCRHDPALSASTCQ